MKKSTYVRKQESILREGPQSAIEKKAFDALRDNYRKREILFGKVGILIRSTLRCDILYELCKRWPGGARTKDIVETHTCTQAAVSHHLAPLEALGFISSDREGRIVTYTAEYREIRQAIVDLLEFYDSINPDMYVHAINALDEPAVAVVADDDIDADADDADDDYDDYDDDDDEDDDTDDDDDD